MAARKITCQVLGGDRLNSVNQRLKVYQKSARKVCHLRVCRKVTGRKSKPSSAV